MPFLACIVLFVPRDYLSKKMAQEKDGMDVNDLMKNPLGAR